MAAVRTLGSTRFGGRGFRAAIAAAVTAGLALTGALVTASAAEAAPLPCTSDLYGSSLGRDTITKTAPSGATTTIATSPAGIPLNSLAYNPVDGYLYANTNGTGELYRIGSDGAATDLGIAVPSSTLGIDSHGIAWAGSGTTLTRIDLTTRAVSTVPLSQSIGSGDFAFIGDTMYAMGVRSVAAVDTVTGTVRVIPVAGNPIASPAALSFDGHLYVSTLRVIGQPVPDLLEVVGLDTASASLVDTGFPWVASDGASCATAPSPILTATDDDVTASPVVGTTGGTTASVFGNDLRGGAAVTAAEVVPTLTADGGVTGATINPDGTITVPAGAAPGTYTVSYRICLGDRPQICDTASVRLRVAAGGVAPGTDPGAGTGTGTAAGPATVTTPAGGHVLAATGSDATPAALAVAGAVALGVGLIVGLRGRRRALTR
ncbi:MAG: LPXTG cell wall anchor domain-containing protein [Actinobacteria bacterium]|nr:LPXTG cell wall anchor domain-containing protein [Actinomycetota bacterium]